MAENTGARYFRAENTTQLAEIYALIDELEPVEQEAETFRPVQALFMWPLGGGLIFLLGAMFLNAAYGGRRGV